jgi:hypothetical protein
MPNLIDRHRDSIQGVLSCFDRVVIQGTLPSVCHAGAMATLLDSRGIRLFDYFVQSAQPFRESIRAHAERLAAEEGVEVEYIKKPKGYRKEDRIREIVARRGNHPGLVHIFSVMELCSSYRPWHDKRTGMTYLRADGGKCVHYYFYFIDKVLGLCFLSIPTWCPFRAQFYFNGHNWLASKLRVSEVSFKLQDNAFAEVGDWRKAQDLSDDFAVAELHARMDRAVGRYVPDLAPLGRYHWSIAQAEYATDIVFRSAADLAPLYDHLLRTSIHAVKADDIATFLGRSPTNPGDHQIGGDFSIPASTAHACATTWDQPRSRCTTSTASFFASRPRSTTSHSSDTTAWWNSATVSE